MTNQEAAAALGCSVSTAKRWACSWCEQPMLYVAKGECAAIRDRCDTKARTAEFRDRHGNY